MDEQIRAIQEYLYNKYIEPSDHGDLDEEAAVRVLEEHYGRPELSGDPDCFFVGVLYFELGYEDEEKQIEYFRRAKYWLDRWKALAGEEWDPVDDRLLDLADFFTEQGIDPGAGPSVEPVAAAPALAPHIIEEIDDHGPMLLVAAGTFLFGTEKSEVDLPAFYIDKYQVTNREYEAFCRATGYRWPKFLKEDRFNVADAPVVGISLADALRYCRWVGKTLPTEEQWEKACRGSDGRTYPWGEDEPSGELACYGRDPASEGTATVTSHPENVSPYGVFELAGNVWEWTASTVEDGEPVHVVKGGCYNDPASLLRSDSLLLAAPKDKYETIGFRCVKTA